MSDVNLVVDCQCTLGEGPMWVGGEQALYWVDIMGNAFHRWEPASGAQTRYDIGQPVGTVVPRAAGGMVLALKDGLFFWDAINGLQAISDPERDKPNNRFNDGAVDRQGRFWAGTMSMEGEGAVGALYRLDTDHSLYVMTTNIIISNGLGWSPDNQTMYYCDTGYRTIWAYDFDPATGAIANRRDFAVVPDAPGEGGPDGLTVDSEGFIWSARWGGWKIVRYDPAGKIEREVAIPAERVTSVMFGGPDLEDLYVTTARIGLDAAEIAANQPHAGSIFHLRPGVKGLPEPAYGG
jgi:sugar lactone lactonase YvrE